MAPGRRAPPSVAGGLVAVHAATVALPSMQTRPDGLPSATPIEPALEGVAARERAGPVPSVSRRRETPASTVVPAVPLAAVGAFAIAVAQTRPTLLKEVPPLVSAPALGPLAGRGVATVAGRATAPPEAVPVVGTLPAPRVPLGVATT